MKKLILVLVIFSLLYISVSAQGFFEGCGYLQDDIEGACLWFVPDNSYEKYMLENYGQYHDGDYVFVSGYIADFAPVWCGTWQTLEISNNIIFPCIVDCEGIRGNVDGDTQDIIEISDLIFLIDYMFRGGRIPVSMEEADVNGDGINDINDLVYLIVYMFSGGEAPMPCPEVIGATWTPRESNTSSYLYGVAYSGERFVAVGSQGGIVVSEDGTEWQEVLSPTDYFLSDLIWVGGQFVAVGYSALYNIPAIIIHSEDGLSWSSASSIPEISWSPDDTHIEAVTYNGSEYLAVGYNGLVLKSPDGDVWAKVVESVYYHNLVDVTWDGVKYMAVGWMWGESAGYALTAYSPDGVSWTYHSLTDFDYAMLFDIFWDGNQFIASGGNPSDSSYSGVMFRSDDGIDWSVLLSDLPCPITDITKAENTYIATGEAGLIMTSIDGIDWILRDYMNYFEQYSAVACSGERIVVVGGNGFIITSP